MIVTLMPYTYDVELKVTTGLIFRRKVGWVKFEEVEFPNPVNRGEYIYGSTKPDSVRDSSDEEYLNSKCCGFEGKIVRIYHVGSRNKSNQVSLISAKYHLSDSFKAKRKFETLKDLADLVNKGESPEKKVV